MSLDLGGAPIAAAIDMISYMDFGGHLGEEFQAYRCSLGLAPETPYFNNGLTVIDRSAWTQGELGERTLRFIAANPKLCLRFEQSALNALLKGDFAQLSPRFNFMGDFLLLDLEARSGPMSIISSIGRSPGRRLGRRSAFCRAFHDWFANSPWPDFPDVEPIDNSMCRSIRIFASVCWPF